MHEIEQYLSDLMILEVFSNLNGSVILCDELGDEGLLHSQEVCFAPGYGCTETTSVCKVPTDVEFVHRDLEDEVTPSVCLTRVFCN